MSGFSRTFNDDKVIRQGAAVLAAAFLSTAAATDQRRPDRTPDIYFTPTRQAVADAMLKLARVTADDVVYDLGSGDGRIVILVGGR